MSSLPPHLPALLGIVAFVAIGWLLSEARSSIKWRPVGVALGVQAVLAATMLRFEPVRHAFEWLAGGIGKIKEATEEGTRFVFGYVGSGNLDDIPFAVTATKSTFVFAFQALPMVMVVSALSMLLFYWQILPWIVRGSAVVMRYTLGIGGALGVCAAAKVFLGMTEAPLLIRPYLGKLSRHELFCVMTLGMATTSAAVMAIYSSILASVLDDAGRHILTASCISVPAAVAMARLLVPPDDKQTAGDLNVPYRFANGMDAVSRGAADGMQMYLNIIPMLIVSLALVFLLNAGLGLVWAFGAPLSLQRMLGWALSPVALGMGVPWEEALTAGRLLGTKLALNEVLAFRDLAQLAPGALGDHGRLILTYALCGFANLGSIGILIGGIGTMVPERRAEIIAMSSRSLVGGALSTCMSGTLVGLLS